MPDTTDTSARQTGAAPSTAKVDASPRQPPKPVREWAFLLGGITLSAVLAIAFLAALFLARRRQRLKNLQQDWRVRRSKERDAWAEAGRRAEAPTAQQLEAHATPDAPEEASDDQPPERNS